MITILIVLTIIGTIVLDALSDAYIDKERRRNHFLELSTVLLFLCLIMLAQVSGLAWYVIITSYILLRIGLFNLVYNYYRKLDLFYRGTTDKFYDKFMKKIPDSLYLFILIVATIIGILIII